jgi:hypothetical protein
MIARIMNSYHQYNHLKIQIIPCIFFSRFLQHFLSGASSAKKFDESKEYSNYQNSYDTELYHNEFISAMLLSSLRFYQMQNVPIWTLVLGWLSAAFLES